ncbi:uncharacterized protein LACBIDRAFT_307289 [Laccaria bicolor S238N-H82]|uniref:Predicted protein n=1 Tax=Laccaria bicolor (strain S238N-H82 / ATCC MYA-4686) TaxID=486041 RepID=B0DPU1_LACBS|nr:uncharacterized protein LACBIDRAFT_307289 [Laccaria bicolor S238N-H82]EDR03431.1 predicted protein [Laccaria bicolor S238N-H82]|eukprot:XP_001885887.1 predicted protein [Laccaria bicolor S238N-H82]
MVVGPRLDKTIEKPASRKVTCSLAIHRYVSQVTYCNPFKSNSSVEYEEIASQQANTRILKLLHSNTRRVPREVISPGHRDS